MKTTFFPATTRGQADYGWLKANYSFSFSSYYDPNRLQFGLLRVLNDDVIAPGMGFGTHPHSNMEIVSIPLSGSLKHRDSMGHEAVIKSGEVQVMSAGSGIEHSEFNASKTDPVNLLQIWVFTDKENHTPRYDQKELSEEKMNNQLYTFLQPNADEQQVWIHQDAYFSMGTWDKKDTINYSLNNKANGVYAFVIKGKVTIGEQLLSAKDALGITDSESIAIDVEEGSTLLLLEVPMQ